MSSSYGVINTCGNDNEGVKVFTYLVGYLTPFLKSLLSHQTTHKMA
jgi:hypothetical protein